MMRFDGEIPPRIWSLKSFKIFSIKCLCYLLTANSNLRSLEVLLVLFLPFCVYYHQGLSFLFQNFFFLSIFFNCHHFSMVTIHYFDPWRWLCYFTTNCILFYIDRFCNIRYFQVFYIFLILSFLCIFRFSLEFSILWSLDI